MKILPGGFLALLLVLLLVPIAACSAVGDNTAQATQHLSEGVIEFDASYDGLGAMSAFLPKTRKVFFRQGQRREESGTSVKLVGVEPGKEIQLMDVGEVKMAFVYPEGSNTEPTQDLRFEPSGETQLLAGLQAREIAVVDARDPSNRLSLWVTEQVDIEATPYPGLQGFALDYITPMNDGEAHYRVRSATSQVLADSLFEIPADYERRELQASSEMMAVITEIFAGSGEEVQIIQGGEGQ